MPKSRRSFEERFWAKVDRSGGPDACWPWQGGVNRDGYGIVVRNGHATSASRVAYELTNGNLGEQLACHSCDHPWCCNPSHIWAGTQSQNIQDSSLKGRRGNRPIPASQVNALRFIQNYITTHQYPPSLREVMDGIGLNSTSATRYTIRRLAERGFIEITPGVARGIRLVNSISQLVNTSVETL